LDFSERPTDPPTGGGCAPCGLDLGDFFRKCGPDPPVVILIIMIMILKFR
jgi:hypothetical protein